MKRLIKFLFKAIILIAIILEILVLVNANKSPKGTAQYIIVPGARVKDANPMLALKYRLDAAYEYYTLNPGIKIVTTGAASEGESISEAMAAKNYLVSMGVAEADVVCEENSKNTIENLEFATDLVGKDKNYLIVSNGFHMFRLDILSNYLGIKHELLSAKTPKEILIVNYLREVPSIFYLAYKVVRGKI